MQARRADAGGVGDDDVGAAAEDPGPRQLPAVGGSGRDQEVHPRPLLPLPLGSRLAGLSRQVGYHRAGRPVAVPQHGVEHPEPGPSGHPDGVPPGARGDGAVRSAVRQPARPGGVGQLVGAAASGVGDVGEAGRRRGGVRGAGQADAVAPGALDLAQRRVGVQQQVGEPAGGGADRVPGVDAERDGHSGDGHGGAAADRGRYGQLPYLLPDTSGGGHRLAGAGVGQQHQELVARVAPVASGDRSLDTAQHLRGGAQHGVPGEVSVGVVDALEAVEVAHDDGERTVSVAGECEGLGGPDLPGPPHQQPGEVIGRGAVTAPRTARGGRRALLGRPRRSAHRSPSPPGGSDTRLW